VYLAKTTKPERQVGAQVRRPMCHDRGAKRGSFARRKRPRRPKPFATSASSTTSRDRRRNRLFIAWRTTSGQRSRKLEAGALAPADALEIAGEIARGLRSAAQASSIETFQAGHLIVTDDGVKILDFGLAKLRRCGAKLTLEGSTVAPSPTWRQSRRRGEEADERSDIWRLGVVPVRNALGRPPFKGAYPEASLLRIKTRSRRLCRGSGRGHAGAVEGQSSGAPWPSLRGAAFRTRGRLRVRFGPCRAGVWPS